MNTSTTFARSFRKDACIGDSITQELPDGTYAVATLASDDSAGAPQEMQDGFWPSRDSKAAGYVPADKFDGAQAYAERVMDAYDAGEWGYVGVVLSIKDAGGEPIDSHAASLWGIEMNYPGSDNSYLTEVANDLLSEYLDSVRVA